MFKRLRSKTNEEVGPASAPKQTNKLSKPRTNKHTSATPLKQAGKNEPRRQVIPDLSDEPESRYGSALSGADKYKVRREAHSQIFGEFKAIPYNQEDSLDHGEDSDEPSLDLSSSVAHQRSLAASRTSTLPSPSNDTKFSSPVHSPVSEQFTNVPSAATLAQRLRGSASQDALSASRDASDATDICDAVHTDGDAQSDEPNDSIPNTMIRARSYATPGVATRQPRIGIPSPLRSYSVYEEEDNESVEAGLENVSPLPPPRDFLWRGETASLSARAQTPSEVDYGRISTMRLGGLVITNGKASPEPSIFSGRQVTPVHSVADFWGEDDYFTASEGEFSPVLKPQIPTMFNFDRDQSWGQEQQDSGAVISSPSASRASNLSGHGSDRFLPRNSSPSRTEVIVTKSSDDSLGSLGFEHGTRSTHLAAPSIIRSASQFARSYCSELQESPYEPEVARTMSVKRVMATRTISGQSVQSASVYSVASDEGFAEPTKAEPIAQQVQASGNPQRAPLNEHETDLEKRSNVTTSRQQLREDENLQQSTSNLGQLNQPTADSGYSSGSSVGDVRTPAEERDDISISDSLSMEEDFQLSNPKKRLSKGSDRVSLYTFDQMLGKLPPVAAHYMEPHKPRLPEEKPKRVSLLRSVSWGRAKSEAALASTTGIPNIESADETLTVDNTAPAVTAKAPKERKKLQKTRPPPRPVVTMPGRPLTADDAVPRIPTLTRVQHNDRINARPESSHLERTSVIYEGAGQHDQERVESKLEIRFPSPTLELDIDEYDEMATRKKRKSWRLSRTATSQAQDDRPPTPPQHRTGVSNMFRRISRNDPAERKPHQYYHGEDAVIADFATAAISLGGSPYDIATETARGGERPKFNTNSSAVIHPHQISTHVSRPRSWVEMDDATAAEFAREKSRQKAAMAAARDEAARGRAPPNQRISRMPQNPNGLHNDMARPLSRSSSTGSLNSIDRSNGFGERSDMPRRVPSGASDHARGRPQGFREWELNRRSSRSRSRSRTVSAAMINGRAPPVPPLPAKTLEHEEEDQYSNVPFKREGLAEMKMDAPEQQHQSWHRASKSATAPVESNPRFEHEQPTDWSASSDIWRQRRLLLSQTLDAQPPAGPLLPTSDSKMNSTANPTAYLNRASRVVKEADYRELERMEAEARANMRSDFPAMPPPPPPHGRSSIAQTTAAPADSRMLADSVNRRPTPFDRFGTAGSGAPSQPAVSSPLSGRPLSSRPMQYPAIGPSGKPEFFPHRVR